MKEEIRIDLEKVQNVLSRISDNLKSVEKVGDKYKYCDGFELQKVEKKKSGVI